MKSVSLLFLSSISLSSAWSGGNPPPPPPSKFVLRKAATTAVAFVAIATACAIPPPPAHAQLTKNDLEEIGKLMATNNENLRTQLKEDMEKNNEILKNQLGLYPALAATAAVATSAYNTQKLSDAIERFADQKVGFQKSVEANTEAKAFQSGLAGGLFAVLMLMLLSGIAQS